jgi:glycosyltransferase involved in cell wall biosynthesis
MVVGSWQLVGGSDLSSVVGCRSSVVRRRPSDFTGIFICEIGLLTGMHIAINAQLLNSDQSYRSAGVSTYSQNLLCALAESSGEHRISAFLNDPGFACTGLSLHRTQWPAHQPLARIAWEQVALPAALKQVRADLVHGLVNVLPLATRVPGVVTVHDLSFLRMPERFPKAKRFYQTWLCEQSTRRARRVIAVSRQTADDLIKFFGTESQKIEVVYNGVAGHFSPLSPEKVTAFRLQENLPDRFLLYVGTLEPRKNLVRLLEAFARWRVSAPAVDREIALILAGAKGWFYDEIFQRVHSLNLNDVVHFPGFVPTESLPYWYQAAMAFVYPSYFEGFGMPVIEAMACGTPVLCSRAPGVAEVAGDAAHTFAPEDTDAMSQLIGNIVADDSLRSDLRQRGLEHARRFSWQRSAAETLAIYSEALRK